MPFTLYYYVRLLVRNRVLDSKTLLQMRSMLCIAGPGAGALDDPKEAWIIPERARSLSDIFCRLHNFAYLVCNFAAWGFTMQLDPIPNSGEPIYSFF